MIALTACQGKVIEKENLPAEIVEQEIAEQEMQEETPREEEIREEEPQEEPDPAGIELQDTFEDI